MSRPPRFFPAGLPQHIIQRGNNRSICFASDKDFAAYAHWLHEYSVKFNVDIRAWVFMANHVHLLATPSTDNGIALMIQALGLRYVQYFNFTYQRWGLYGRGDINRAGLTRNDIY
jgi:putative transposase